MGLLKLPLRLRGREVRGCVALMGVLKLPRRLGGREGERLCDFDGGLCIYIIIVKYMQLNLS